MFYRFMEQDNIDWRRLVYMLSLRLLNRISSRKDSKTSHFICSRHIKCHLIGMMKMGKTRYKTKFGNLNAFDIIDRLKKGKSVKYSLQRCRIFQPENLYFLLQKRAERSVERIPFHQYSIGFPWDIPNLFHALGHWSLLFWNERAARTGEVPMPELLFTNSKR